LALNGQAPKELGADDAAALLPLCECKMTVVLQSLSGGGRVAELTASGKNRTLRPVPI
jgi:hypothetical protein